MHSIAGLTLALVLSACTPAAGDTEDLREPWEFGGLVPESITMALPSDGTVVNSLMMTDRTVVMVTYPGDRLSELVAFYDERLAGANRSEHTIIAETEAVWMVRWQLSGVEVRVVECIDLFTRQFSQVCVAIDQDG
jgi:hypothetical protein